MKLLNIKNIALVTGFILFAIADVSAQTCSGSNIAVGTSQSCPTVTVASDINSVTNAGTIGSGNFGINFFSSTSPSNITVGTITNAATGSIGSGFYGILIYSSASGANNSIYSTINAINNAGSISGSGYAILSDAALGCPSGCNNSTSHVSIGSITNTGTITGTGSYGIFNTASVGGFGYSGVSSTATIGSIVNSGTISSNYAIYNSGNNISGTNTVLATIDSIQNSGSITGTTYGIINSGLINSIANTGSITAGTTNPQMGINNNGTIGNLTNSGSGLISGYIGIQNGGTINALTNTASITGPDYGIVNYGTITTLNNGQGAGNTNGPLTFYQNLPTNYNIIINSKTSYGQLAINGISGATTFGIYSGGVAGIAASVLNKGTYSSVLSGVLSSNLNNTKGNYNGFTWSLNNSSGTIWDLIVTGASTADTQQSLVNTASALQNTFTLQNTVLANSFTYDCNVFGANNVCVSAGGRNTQVSAANGLNNTSALLIAAYRVMPTVRVGAYADQNLSVNNAGSTVNLGNNTPLIGLFGAWNERLDGTGTEVKVSAAYGQKNTTVNRQIVGLSEAGSGSSQLNSQGAQVTAKYGFGVAENTIVSPYVGVRYTQNNMNGYSEQATSSVTAPLTYSAVNTNATTALAGVGAQYRFIPQATVFASAGVETDTNTSNGTYSATGVAGLTPINFNANPVKTRPTATIGAYYDVEKNQRIGITGIYRQEPYQAVQTTTVMATYTVGL
ncbi:hypothetical protein M2125_001380 [Polynucleobacter sphagniphilus]|uniref:beta strand repeat-containing protein n=1 Tax=Polynucleobacter sphagniphilus TaxID=1743169 RepID=UPI002475D5C3|nr:autotransporter outer membrane beta-barrel domain-containing protein [Polynucleobacter sphagniphilus]MDH6241566.1 hypothetical protein [Polynucleobacter sphagniphilus]